MNAPLPSNERERLRSLRRYAILDTPQEAAFDRITSLVVRLLKVPIAQVTLVDESRQWFKSSCGLDATETGRELSICAHAILSDEVMVVVDAARDPRFTDNALVTGEPRIRFYAGVPLKSSDGYNLGTLCAIDTVPRKLSAEEKEILRDLAAMVCDELELRLAVRERIQQAAVVTNLSSGVLLTDPNQPDDPIIFSNPGFSAITGYSFEEIVGRNCRFLQGPKTDQNIIRDLRKAIAERRGFQGVLLNYRKDGTPFWNELTISPVFDQEGQLISFVGLQTDVTNRKRTSDQLQQSFEKLKELEALRDNLTHMIIHDLRSPLTAIIGYLDLLQMKAAKKLEPDEMHFLDVANNGAETLQEMITSLLDVNRLEAGEMPLNLQQTDIGEIVKQATDPLKSIIGTRSLNFDLQAASVFCDADLIRRVVTNLVSNAIKFTPDGGQIRVAVESKGAGVKVSITDTGPGIPTKYHSKIFEKFGQIDGSRHRHSTGLGLTYCKLAIEAHGGTIGVESSKGKGSTFWFVLLPK